MKTLLSFAAFALALAPSVLMAKPPQRGGEQEGVFKDTQQGAVLSPRAIENGVVPGMKAQGASYIGQEYYQDDQRYRLKFMRGKSLIWVDVDGKSGAIIGKAGG